MKAIIWRWKITPVFCSVFALISALGVILMGLPSHQVIGATVLSTLIVGVFSNFTRMIRKS